MGPSIFVGLLVVADVVLIWRYVRVKRQTAESAAHRVRAALRGNERGNETKVYLADCHPLSVHMIKDLGETEGYRYQRTASTRSGTELRFEGGTDR
nr:hypothetical protein [Kibdelosporangium sp. MJ126-NF4]CEL15540.1 hypothetical protein [Kibdelosporangium sp. MJ126-NF4]CTQ98206.1 hypothetical protein [Kibdelosporangium sp. MJ126-NF4]